MNIKISSLDPNAPRASKDCRVCNRRRIKCDRSLPSCRKCEIRRLGCTGYDQKLKWNQGVASRGKYAGQAAPISLESASRHRDFDRLARECLETSPEMEEDVECSPTSEISLSHESFGMKNLSGGNETGRQPAVDEQYEIDLTLSWPQTPHIYEDPQVRRLISHYDHHVANTFVWIDTPENRWRNDVIPLAHESPSLRFAILALASTHLSSKLPASNPLALQLSTKSIRYREQSLQLLARHLGNETQMEHLAGSISSILATMYILCNAEMVPSDSEIWRLHLRASYIMIRRWLSTTPVTNMLDSTSLYLVTQFSIINVFASTTSFGPIEKFSNIDFAKGPGGWTLFSDYLEAIHEITVEERERDAIRGLGVTLESVDIAIIVAKLENARCNTQAFSHSVSFATEQLKCEFERVVNAYHHSGILYAYQALADPIDVVEWVPYLLHNLLNDLTLISTNGPFAQDLSWPLFICGTACRDLENEQRLLERLMKEEMKATGFSNCQLALKFLKAFWCGAVDGETWIQFGRRHSQRQEFLAL